MNFLCKSNNSHLFILNICRLLKSINVKVLWMHSYFSLLKFPSYLQNIFGRVFNFVYESTSLLSVKIDVISLFLFFSSTHNTITCYVQCWLLSTFNRKVLGGVLTQTIWVSSSKNCSVKYRRNWNDLWQISYHIISDSKGPKKKSGHWYVTWYYEQQHK